MGQLKTDGRAIDIVAPAATAMTFGELYRVDGWTGFAMRTLAAADVDKNLALEVSSERIWYCVVPAAVNGARGTLVYWTAGAGFKRATTDLTSTATGGPVGIIEEARDGNGVAAIRVFNGANLVV
jgi:hypothetical protein